MRGFAEGQPQGLREAGLDALAARFGEISYPTQAAISHPGHCRSPS